MILRNFRIYPEDKHYYRVIIFDSKESMLRYWYNYRKKSGQKKIERDFEGICQSYEIRLYKKNKATEIIKNEIGFILLWKGRIDVEVISHEMCHAVTYWCKKVGFNLNTSRIISKNDERYAYAVGSMVKQFWREYYKTI
jgi:hypothetical protein